MNISEQPLFHIDTTSYWPIMLNMNVKGIDGNYKIEGGPFQREDQQTIQLLQPVKRSYGGEKSTLANATGHGTARGANEKPAIRTMLQVFPAEVTLETILAAIDAMNARHAVIQSHLRYRAFTETISFRTAVTNGYKRLMAEEGIDEDTAIARVGKALIEKQRVPLMEDGKVVLDANGEKQYMTHGQGAAKKYIYRKYTLCSEPTPDINETATVELLSDDRIMAAMLEVAFEGAQATI